MAFQFNFTIEETESSLFEGELSVPSDIGSPLLINKGENSGNNKLPLGDSEVEPETTQEVKKTGLMTSSVKNNIFSCSNTSNNCLVEEKTCWIKFAKEHKIPEDVSRVLENKIVESSSGLQFVNVSVVEMTLLGKDSNNENIVSKTVTSNSDLISGVYEGGMKIWECTFDLMRYFEDEDIHFERKRVLDLGCGAGFLGLFALKRKAREVHFQDYNSTVIEEITMPNALLNCDRDDFNEYITEEPSRKRHKKSEVEPGLLSKCRFFSGEWSQFSQLMQNEIPSMKYDIILTSETIYNPAYYSALHDIFQKLLLKDGIVYLATKSHYFGVGGGVHPFEKFIRERNVFCTKTLKVHEDGLQRLLINLEFINNS
ncbi:histidine protein methyltransferase 1 homolog [Rhinophrynus dorsalis]